MSAKTMSAKRTARAARSQRSHPARALASFFVFAMLEAASAFAAQPKPAAQPEAAATLPAAAVESVWHRAQDLAIYSLGLLGVDYKFGGTSPERGLDCSGLVRYVFQQVTGVTLPHTAQGLSRLGEKVTLAELVPGDLVFFNTRRLPFSHVGIYIGDDRFIHAPRRGGEVEIVTLSKEYWQKHFDGARRLIAALPGSIGDAEAATAPPQVPQPTQGPQVRIEPVPAVDTIRGGESIPPEDLFP
jgi:cell wall-associated NlpC family hydrolase